MSGGRDRGMTPIRLRRLYLGGSLFGNAAEWADLAAIAVMAPLLARWFFGGEDMGTATAVVFAALAGGFVMRLVGALLYGHLADRSPLKGPLLLSASAMGLFTLSLALLPSAATMGTAAGLLFIGLRLLQGMAAAGESALNASVRAALPRSGRLPVLAMLADAAPAAGILLVLAAAALAWPATPEQEAAGTWRLVLFVAPALALAALAFRLFLPHTAWQAPEGLPRRPALSALTAELPRTLLVAALSAPLAARLALLALIGLAALELQTGGTDGRTLSQALVLATIWLASAMLCAMGTSAIASMRGLTATLRPILVLATALGAATAASLLCALPVAALFGIALLPVLAAADPLLPWRACIAAPDRTLISSQTLAQAIVFAPAGLLLPVVAQPQAVTATMLAFLAIAIAALALLALAATFVRRR